MQVIAVLIVLAILLFLITLPASLKIVQEYERGVIFRLGRCVGAKGPGTSVYFRDPDGSLMEFMSYAGKLR